MADALTGSIRDMVRSDVTAVARLEREVFPQPWSESLFRDELDQPNRTYIVAESGGELLGYAGLLIVDEDAHITTIAVAESGRGRRLGSRMLLALLQRSRRRGARHMTLEVRASNRDARRLYERFGFSVVGKRKNYYRDEDALVMWATGIDTPEYRELLEALQSESEGEAVA